MSFIHEEFEDKTNGIQDNNKVRFSFQDDSLLDIPKYVLEKYPNFMLTEISTDESNYVDDENCYYVDFPQYQLPLLLEYLENRSKDLESLETSVICDLIDTYNIFFRNPEPTLLHFFYSILFSHFCSIKNNKYELGYINESLSEKLPTSCEFTIINTFNSIRIQSPCCLLLFSLFSEDVLQLLIHYNMLFRYMNVSIIMISYPFTYSEPYESVFCLNLPDYYFQARLIMIFNKTNDNIEKNENSIIFKFRDVCMYSISNESIVDRAIILPASFFDHRFHLDKLVLKGIKDSSFMTYILNNDVDTYARAVNYEPIYRDEMIPAFLSQYTAKNYRYVTQLYLDYQYITMENQRSFITFLDHTNFTSVDSIYIDQFMFRSFSYYCVLITPRIFPALEHISFAFDESEVKTLEGWIENNNFPKLHYMHTDNMCFSPLYINLLQLMLTKQISCPINSVTLDSFENITLFRSLCHQFRFTSTLSIYISFDDTKINFEEREILYTAISDILGYIASDLTVLEFDCCTFHVSSLALLLPLSQYKYSHLCSLKIHNCVCEEGPQPIFNLLNSLIPANIPVLTSFEVDTIPSPLLPLDIDYICAFIKQMLIPRGDGSKRLNITIRLSILIHCASFPIFIKSLFIPHGDYNVIKKKIIKVELSKITFLDPSVEITLPGFFDSLPVDKIPFIRFDGIRMGDKHFLSLMNWITRFPSENECYICVNRCHLTDVSLLYLTHLLSSHSLETSNLISLPTISPSSSSSSPPCPPLSPPPLSSLLTSSSVSLSHISLEIIEFAFTISGYKTFLNIIKQTENPFRFLRISFPRMSLAEKKNVETFIKENVSKECHFTY
ncbi:hypothetical protein WA158_003243 [Blastocystis sp. Blastoise]